MTSTPILAARALFKSFFVGKTEVPVLRHVELAVARGEFVAVVGASGSGKSTLLSLLAGLDRPSSGEILFDGQSLGRLPENELARLRREKVGFVFQSFHLVPSLTVQENVHLPLAFRGHGFSRPETADALVNTVGLADRSHFLPERLSGGERQRVAIARALVNDPLVVFADEPTGNLDSANGARILDLLEEKTRRAGRTLVLVTHDPAIAARADRRIHLKDGRVTPA